MINRCTTETNDRDEHSDPASDPHRDRHLTTFRRSYAFQAANDRETDPKHTDTNCSRVLVITRQ